MFKLKEHGTDVKTEVIAGVTTFLTMVYIVAVNPAILEHAGIPKGPSMVATALSAFFGTLAMGLYANRPFAIAPYMGENAFIAYTVVKVLGYPWQTALGAIFISGVLFVILTLARARVWMAKAVPDALKYSFAAGIGLFLTFIGLMDSGIVTMGTPGAPVKIGDLGQPTVLLAIFGTLLMAALMVMRIRAFIIIGILSVTFLAYIFGLQKPPKTFVSLPPSLGPIFLKLDILGALKWGFFPVILTVFVMDFVDTMGTLIGLAARAGMLDERGNLPEIEKPMLVDAGATVLGALLGTTTSGTYIESAAGIEAGGRTGLTSVVTAGLFLLTLFFAPLFTSIPPYAYGPALILVGAMMLEPLRRIDFSDYTEIIPAFIAMTMMVFTFNLGIGITAGFLAYPIFKLVARRWREVAAGTWVLAALSLIFYIFYPY
ncbi:NCS2 family permease [Candidatus Poribacteria bacterium]|nr:MAG: NCS2 family permease [Candidatus Poribacteria bacterium]